MATMAPAALFSYPIGLVPALASGLAYHFCAQRLPGHRVGASVLICLTGVLVMAAMRSMWMPVAPWVLLPIAGVSADLLILLAVVGGLTLGPDRGAIVGFAAGLSYDIFLQSPLGLRALVFCLVGFVAGRWSSPFWQIWDLLMLWLAMLHGGNGMRTVINDYAERDHTRFWLRALLYVAIVFIVALGTLVIFTFDPNIG